MGSILLVAALLPAIALMAYVYSRDRVEREPVRLVAKVFFLGAASGIVAGIVESILIEGVEAAVPDGLLRLFLVYFICVAAVEETCKFVCLNTVRRNPAFDYVFDAVVYSVAAALGFAALENVFYVFDGGLETALVRAVLSVPGHAADGVVMGVFYGLARQRELRGNKAGARVYYFLAILLPTIEHGFYDAALSTESDFMAFAAVVFDLIFIFVAYKLVKRTSAIDKPFDAREAGRSGVFSASMPQSPTTSAPYSPPLSASLQQSDSRQPVQTPTAPSQPQGMGSPDGWACSRCGAQAVGNFCGNCGAPRSSA